MSVALAGRAAGYRKAHLDEDQRRRLSDYANILFERFGCRDYARFDSRTDTAGEVELLELNPSPSWCRDGKLALMVEMAGLCDSKLLRLIIDSVQERLAAQQPGRAIALAESHPLQAVPRR